jgi:hypothetical protein
MIMAMEFLHSTKSFTLNKHRPETIHVPEDDDFEVMAINNPGRRLRRHLDKLLVHYACRRDIQRQC